MELLASTWCSKSAAIVIMAALFIGERPARGSPSRSASDELRRSAQKQARLSSGMLRLGEPRAGAVLVLNLWRVRKSKMRIAAKSALIALSIALACDCAATLRTLDGGPYHLRSGAEPEWQEFAGKVPHGPRLDIRFTAKVNETDATLIIRQTDVKRD